MIAQFTAKFQQCIRNSARQCQILAKIEVFGKISLNLETKYTTINEANLLIAE